MTIESFIRALIYKISSLWTCSKQSHDRGVRTHGPMSPPNFSFIRNKVSETKDKTDQMQFCFYEGPPKVSCIPTPLHDAASFNTQLDWKSCKRTFISKAVASYEPSLNNVVAKLSIFDLFPPLSIFLVHGVYVHTGSFPLTRFSI